MPSLPQKICKACLTAFFILILNITAVRAEELYLEPVIQGNILDETIPVLQKGSRNYIDFEPFAAALQMKVSRQPGNITVVFMGKKTNIPTSSLSAENHLIEAGHYYFEQTYLENLLGVRLKINRLDMQLEIDADKELPVTQKLRALSNRLQIMPYPQYDSFNNYEFDNRFISTPIADFTLQHNYNIRDYNGRNEQRRNSTYYQIDSGMLAGGFDLYTSIFGDSENNSYNPRARITLGRTFLDEPKNALNLVSFEAGDVTGFNSTLFNNSANGRGLLASSFKDLVLSADKTIDISGPISSGWDVELYLNNQLIAFRQPGVNGRYSFANIPVNYGLNTFKLVFYGPYGEIETEERNYYSGTSPVKPGEFGYTLNAYQKDRYLIEDNEPWISATSHPVIDFTGYYGINDNITLISGVSQTYSPETYDAESFGTAGLQYIFGGASVQYNTLFGFNSQKTGHHIDIQGDVKIGTLFARYDYYGEMEVPAAYYDNAFMKDIAEIRLSGYFPYLFIPYYVSYLERNSMDGENFQEIHTRISPNFMQHYNLSIENIFSKTPIGNYDYVLFLLQAQYDKLGIHSQVRTNISPDSYIQSINNQVDYRWDKNTYFQFNWDHEYRSKYSDLPDIDTFSVSAGKIFDFGGLNLGFSYDTDDNAAVMLTYNLSFGKVPGEKRLFTDAETKMSKRAAIYAKVTDEAGKPVANTEINVSGRQNPVRTDENGGALISDIEPYQKTVLSINTESIEDIALVPEFEEKKLVLRPGTIYPLNINCSRRGGVEGYIGGKPELYAYKITLTDQKGKITEKIPEEDGSFIFDDMVFGDYILEVSDKNGIKVYRTNIKLNEAFYTLPEMIKI